MKNFILGAVFGLTIVSCASKILSWRDWKEIIYHPCNAWETPNWVGSFCARKCKDERFFGDDCKEGPENYEIKVIDMKNESTHVRVRGSGMRLMKERK